MYELRKYQADARDAIISEWNAGKRKTLLVLPTGCGKTVVFASVAQHQSQQNRRVLILAHRDELLEQASKKMLAACDITTALEKAESTCLNNNAPVVVGSIQTLQRRTRLDKFRSDYFQDIIIDEAHHCLADTYQRVINHFPTANILGVTATPERGDKKKLGDFFESVAYRYPMSKAIEEGYLCKVKAEMIGLKINIQGVKTSQGDFQASGLGRALDPYLEQIAEEMSKRCKDRKTVVFTPLISTSIKFVEILKKYGLRAAEVNGESYDRKEILSDFENGVYDVLCNSMLLTEGWDCPAVDCIVCLRPTKLRGLYQQMIGRGMRPCQGKDHLLLLDFLWLTEKHDLCKAVDIFQKEDLIDGEGLFPPEPTTERQADHEENLAKNIERNIGRGYRLVDPILFANEIGYYTLAREMQKTNTTYPTSKAPTHNQVEYLRSMGFALADITSFDVASRLIDGIVERRCQRLSTPKQIKVLLNFGFKDVGQWTIEEANQAISQLDKSNPKCWKIPPNLHPETYKPTRLAV